MFGFSREKFSGLITRTEDNIAFVDVADKDGEKSFMEIPKEDLEQSKILFKAGILFDFTLTQFCGWERINFIPHERKIYTKEEIEAKQKYYAEKYGDI